MSIQLDITKQLGDFRLDVHLNAENEILALLGASGCGKSMTLKCIAGMEKPDKGRIIVDGMTLFDSEKHINLTPQKRRAGLMFQNYALFPNMTVRENINAGANREKDKALKAEQVNEMMKRFGLESLASHYPSQLSGGQQQRTALARILVSAPQILLLDEPFSALDSHLRFRLEREVRQVLRDFGKTVVFVSHDRDEVFRLADKIAVMHNGLVDAYGDKKQVFAVPNTRNAAILTGCKNISPIRKLDDHHVLATDWNLELETNEPVGDAKYIGIRMHDLILGEDQNAFHCEPVEVIKNPFSYTVMLRVKGETPANLFGWEGEKALWEKTRANELTISLPPESLMLLAE